jgi:hypothetical protein
LQVFILDNSTSMAPHWPNVLKLLDIMAYIVKKADPDGVDVYLAIDPDGKCQRRSKNTRHLVKFASEHCPSQAPPGNGLISNISPLLDSILQKYRQRNFGRFLGASKAVPKLSLYIFTDGSCCSQPGFDEPIRATVQKLHELDKSQNQIGVQFIRFGDDDDGKLTLEHLDSGLGLPRDIVDTEPFEGGSIWKMLLGSINRWFDGDEASSAADPDNSSAILCQCETAEGVTNLHLIRSNSH